MAFNIQIWNVRRFNSEVVLTVLIFEFETTSIIDSGRFQLKCFKSLSPSIKNYCTMFLLMLISMNKIRKCWFFNTKVYKEKNLCFPLDHFFINYHPISIGSSPIDFLDYGSWESLNWKPQKIKIFQSKYFLIVAFEAKKL